MKTEIILSTTKLCVVILLALPNFAKAENSEGNTTSEFRSVAFDKIPQILTMISDKVRSNYERIKTWQGELSVVTDYIYEGSAAERVFKTNTTSVGNVPKIVGEHRETIIEFSLDAEKDFLYANYRPIKPLQYMDLESGRELGAKGILGRRRAIITPEYQLHCTGDTMRDGVVMSRKAVKKIREKEPTCTDTTTPVFDPRKSFEAGGPIWGTLSRVLQHIDLQGEYSVDKYDLKMEKRTDGNTTEYRIVLPGKITATDYLFVTMIFSGEKGFNVTSFEVTDPNGRLLQKATWDYALVDSIYLPSKTTEQHFERENGQLRYDRISTFRNLWVNQPMPAETFTYKNLGLKNGDKFIDKILGEEYIYQDEALIPVSKEK
ncbi:MAG TPA: hypothetical protein ENH34_02325 [Phycisphaerales bacterium]|nr:hypothetical protein [Phycisphaerales bacterium]